MTEIGEDTRDAIRFFAESGRFPRVGDDLPPWQRFGWLLLYVIEIHRTHPAVPDRWGYHLRQLEAGQLLDEPIPPLDFSTHLYPAQCGRSAAHKMLDKAVRIAEERSAWDAWGDLLDWLCFALGIKCRGEILPSRLQERCQEDLYRAFDLSPFLLEPADHLGEYIAGRKAGGWNPNAFYPTPESLVQTIVEMTMGPGDHRGKTVHDPALGTGRFLLAASNYSLRLSGQDIDWRVIQCCLINGALYAPWMSWPLPKHYFEGDADQDRRRIELLRDDEGLRATATALHTAASLVRRLSEAEPAFEVDESGQGLLFGGGG